MIAQRVISAMQRSGTLSTGKVVISWRKHEPAHYTAGHGSVVYLTLIQRAVYQWDWNVYLFGELVASGGNATFISGRHHAEFAATCSAHIFGVTVEPSPIVEP